MFVSDIPAPKGAIHRSFPRLSTRIQIPTAAGFLFFIEKEKGSQPRYAEKGMEETRKEEGGAW